MEVARVESNLSDALAAKNSEIDALKKEAATSEEKLASLQVSFP